MRPVSERPAFSPPFDGAESMFVNQLQAVCQEYGWTINQLLPQAGEWTPTVTFATPGDLSVSYALRSGRWWLVGGVLRIAAALSFTPTFSTATGELRISGTPAPADDMDGYILPALVTASTLTWPTGRTDMHGFILEGQTYLRIFGTGSGAATTPLAASNFSSGNSVGIRVQGFYPVA